MLDYSSNDILWLSMITASPFWIMSCCLPLSSMLPRKSLRAMPIDLGKADLTVEGKESFEH